MILKKLNKDAKMRLNDEVDSAVITVPAYFTERQKFATREAGQLAGLKVKKVIDEPTAAAIAYGMDRNDQQDRMILVFDLGGGTFDVSILLMAAGIVSQMDNEGDMWLGGDDFDRLIMDEVIHHVEKEEGLEGLSENREFMYTLKKKARAAKEILSSQDSAEIIITEGLKDDTGLPISVEYEITRREFDRLIQPYVTRAMDIVKKALAEASLDKDDIDAVLLVGGSSTIPKFQQELEVYFGKEKILHNIDPMTSVAQGAAMLAKSLDDYVWCPECNHQNAWEAEKCEKCGIPLGIIKDEGRKEAVFQRTAKPYGIEIKGNRFEEIMPKNSAYPTDKEDPYRETFKTVVPDQRIVKIPVREGSAEKASQNEFMGNIWFRDLPPGLPEGTAIEVSMGLDDDMVFVIGCRIPGIDWARESTLQHDGWQNAALDDAMNAHLEIQREGVTGREAEEMESHVQGIERAVKSGDRTEAQQHMKQLKEINDQQDEKAKQQVVPADWRIGIQNVIAIADLYLTRVRPVLPVDNENVQAFDEWMERAKAVLDADDEVKGRDLADEGLKKLLALPLVGELVNATVVSNTPHIDPALTTRLEQAKQDLLSHIDRKDVPGINAAIERFRNVLMEGMKQLGEDITDPLPKDFDGILDK
jgi:molecular chaperone DnaK